MLLPDLAGLLSASVLLPSLPSAQPTVEWSVVEWSGVM